MDQKRTLTGAERTAVRQAIARHSRWPAYAREAGINQGGLTSALCLHLCQLWDIDVDAVIAAATTNGKAAGGSSGSDGVDALAECLRSVLSRPVIDEDAVRAIVEECLDGRVQRQEIALTRFDGKTVNLSGHFHPSFPTLLRAVSTGENVWISGPTGSGKTHAARQVAEALDLPFYVHGGMSMEYQLLGFVRPGDGVYQSTDFRQAYQHGGVCLLDECDTYDPVVTLCLNAALDNGHCGFPDVVGGVKRHENFRCIASANTWGSGATAEFVGRNKLDAAFLGRFPIKLSWEYDEEFERGIPGMDDAFVRRVQRARKLASERGLKVVIHPRHSRAGSKLIAAGFSQDEAAEFTYLVGLTADQKQGL